MSTRIGGNYPRDAQHDPYLFVTAPARPHSLRPDPRAPGPTSSLLQAAERTAACALCTVAIALLADSVVHGVWLQEGGDGAPEAGETDGLGSRRAGEGGPCSPRGLGRLPVDTGFVGIERRLVLLCKVLLGALVLGRWEYLREPAGTTECSYDR